MPNSPPVIANPDTVVAAAGTGPIGLGIAAPTDPDNDTLTITLDTVPGYGTVEYFSGSGWTPVGAGTGLTADQLASLRYTPPPSGEFGGGSIGYSVFDGAATVHGTTEVSVVVDSAGPASLVFSARESDTRNADLYTVDTAGNLTPAPLNPDPGFGSLAGENGGFHQFAGNLYFMAFTPTTNEALFKLDPSGTVTPVQGSEPGDGFFQNTYENAHFTEFAGSLYFRAISATAGDELIKLNGDGTTHSFDINPGGNGSAAGANGGFTEFDGSLYFSGFPNLTSQSHGTPDLIKLDAAGTLTAISTRTDPSNGSDAGVDGGFIVFNHALYFHAYDDTVGDALFRLDAGSTTPVLVDPTGSHINHAFTGVDAAFHEFNGSLYFNDYSVDVANQTLIKLDAGGALTGVKFSGEALQFAGSLGGFVDFAGSTYFVATTNSKGTELFKLDAAGVGSQITDVVGDAFDAYLVSGFVEFAGSLYFDAYNGVGGDNLCKLSAGGVLTTVDLGTGGGTTNAGVEGGFQEFAGSLYFSSYTTTGYELVRLDADGTVTPYDINPDAPGSLHNSEAGKDGGFGVFPHTILNGGPGKDIVVGGIQDETLNGGPRADRLEGRGGNDVVDGGAGFDTAIFSGRRADYHTRLLGNGFIEIADLRPGSPDGTDQFIRVEQFIFADGSSGAGQVLSGVTIIGTNREDFINAHHTAPRQPLPTDSSDTIFGRGGADTIYGLGGNDRIFGGGGSDQIFGGPGNDLLVGGPGPDQMFGGTGNDLLLGGPGDDRLFGGPGRDRLGGGTGHNLLSGGPGTDRFVFGTLNTLGTVVGFIHGVDKLELARHVFKSIQHVSYVAATGDVLFDADGPGGAAPIKFAALAPHLHITDSDFLFV